MNEEERNRILEERKKWYALIPVQFEIIKNLHHRELCFLSQKEELIKHPVRYLIAFNISYLNKHFERFDFLDNLINMYNSCAILRDVPVFSYNLKLRKEADEYKEFNENYDKYVTSYDFFLDIDGKEDFELAFSEAKEIKKILEEYHLPFFCLNSSFNGFHFVVPSMYLPTMEINKLLKILEKVMINIKGIYDFKTLDTSIVDLKRVRKVPYSYECSGAICLPLSDFMLDNFKKENVTMSNVLRTITIKNRGNLVRNLDLGEEQLKENVKKFLLDFQ